MKKIVALVLSLVMVLGLATTAFAAELNGSYDIKGTYQGAGTYDITKLEVFDAKAPKDTSSPKDGLHDVDGNVKYFTVTTSAMLGDTYFVQVATVAEADWIVTYDGKDTVFAYLKGVDSPYYSGTGVPFTNFGEACGQVDYAGYDADVKYYSFENKVYEATETASQEVLMIDGKLVAVDLVNVAPNAHVAEYTYDKDYKVVGVKCAECGVAATIYANYAAVPAAEVKAGNAFGLPGGAYYCWTAVKAPVAGDKVESAETFDAGIAMYVGMSVMAAAGSAVVLKKKD